MGWNPLEPQKTQDVGVFFGMLVCFDGLLMFLCVCVFLMVC